MQEFQERVIIEKSELDQKISKLSEFMVTDLFKGLDEEEKGRMVAQLTHMTRYSQVLKERIAAFK
jgi:hypothetical protein